MQDLKPLRLGPSVALFGGAALLFRLCVYGLLPGLQRRGVAPFWAFLVSYTVPLSVLMAATFYGLAREGNLACWPQRLRRLTGRQVGACLGLFAVGFLLTGLLGPTARYLAAVPLFRPPDFLPAILNPLKVVPGRAVTEFMGVPLKGAYWLPVVYFVFLTVFNILGEELWFRGYLLPRQELVWGRKT